MAQSTGIIAAVSRIQVVLWSSVFKAIAPNFSDIVTKTSQIEKELGCNSMLKFKTQYT